MEHPLSFSESAMADDRPAPRHVVALFACMAFLVLLIGAFLWTEIPHERDALRSIRDAVEQSMAPDGVVLVDDRLLGWALRRGGDGALRHDVWVAGKDVTVDSLPARMVREQRHEILVLATPDGELIRQLDAAGFSVAQEVGWVSWDVKRDGH